MIYLDSGATTPCDARVVEAMLPHFFEQFGNASSPHFAGARADDAVETAREKVAALVNARESEIVWTSGATESNNLAIGGLARAFGEKRHRIVTTAIEHKAVLGPCRKLQKQGFELLVLPVDRVGTVDLEVAKRAINDQTLFVSIQAANHEIGTIQPVREIAALAHGEGAFVHREFLLETPKLVLGEEKRCRTGFDLCVADELNLGAMRCPVCATRHSRKRANGFPTSVGCRRGVEPKGSQPCCK